MSVVEHAMAAGAGHGQAEDRPGINRLGLWLFMASESMLFFALAAARFYLGGEKPHLNLGLGVGLTVILLASSWLGYVAVGAIGRDDRATFHRATALAVILGVLFVVGVGVEWTTAEFAQDTRFGTAFFSMTGLHVFHLLTGLGGLIGISWLGARGHFGPGDHWGVTAVVRYWTFVDVMWLVVVFPVLYLL